MHLQHCALSNTTNWKDFTLSSHSPANAWKMEIRLTMGTENGKCAVFDGIRLKVPGLAGKYEFTGKREDEDTGGLLYFGARWYDPESCRFVTEDPVKNGGNWYLYCRDNPINRVDPTGEVDSSVNLGQYAYSWSQTYSNAYSNAGNIGQATAQHGESLTANTAPGACSYSATANIGQATATIGEGFVSRTSCSVTGNTASVTTSFASQDGIGVSTTSYADTPNGFSAYSWSISIPSFNFSRFNKEAFNRGIGLTAFGMALALHGFKCASFAFLTAEMPPVAVGIAIVSGMIIVAGEFCVVYGLAQTAASLFGKDLVEDTSKVLGSWFGNAVDALPFRI